MKDPFAPVTSTVQAWIDNGYYPGASVLVAKDNRVIYEKCFGSYKAETVVFIASAGKWLAAATIAAVVDEGKLGWDEPASKSVATLKDDPKGRATLRQLLSHTAGYPPYQPEGRPRDDYQTLAEAVAQIAPLPPKFIPGERFDYGGLAMQVAGRMAELATGKDWESLFQEKIAKPLRMNDTHFTPVDRGGGHSPMLGGGARSTLHDYANFLSMISNDGVFEGRRVLSKESIREMQADQLCGAKVEPGKEFVEVARGEKHNGIYGLGEWRELVDPLGEPVLLSSPSWAGTYPWIDKTCNVYGIVLAHVEGPAAARDKFSSFYGSAPLAMLVRQILAAEDHAPATSGPTAHVPFKHPGILHTSEDIDRMRKMVAAGTEPWKGGFEKLKAHEDSQPDYRLRGPFERAGRGPNTNEHVNEIMHDCNAAYQTALMWAITGDERYAQKSVEILNAWSSVHKQQTGRDVQLGAGLWGFKFVSAAEILRYTYPKWEQKDIKQCEKMFREVFYPPIKDFATFANGNWDGACIKTIMAIGVFCDDREIFGRGVDYFYHGKGNGRITNYVINDAGQCQESGRDQAHTQLGLGLLAEACEIGWNQGIDMWSAEENRLLAGFEYTAKYNLGEDVAFTETTDTTGKYHHTKIATDGRGNFRPVWELPFNHYVMRRGLKMPYTEQVLKKIRPEGAAWTADHPGFGTVLFMLPDK